jgi:hypothetical protein
VISVVETEYHDKKSGRVVELQFWNSDISAVDFEKDWRFCEVGKKRRQSKFLGLVENLSFPVEYPLILTNGTIISNNEYQLTCEDY